MKKRIIKYIAWSVTSLLALFIAWQALLVANVYMAKKTARAMIGNNYYMHDYYYADISNITYKGHNFLLYVQKPFLFSPKHFYLYSSKDGTTWKREFTSMFGGLDTSFQEQRFEKQQVFDESGIWYGFADEKCLYNKCSFPKDYYLVNFPVYNKSERCSIYYQTSPSSAQFVKLLSSNNCETSWHVSTTKEKLFPIPDQESYPEVNLKSFMVLNNLAKRANLNISLGIAHTTYGVDKYVGVYKQINDYYLLISSDGVHYEVKKLPSDITDSLAISVFSD